jgi:hypothetical protein
MSSYNDDSIPLPIAELSSFLKSQDDVYTIQSRIRNADSISIHRNVWAENSRTKELIPVKSINLTKGEYDNSNNNNNNKDNTTIISSEDDDRSYLLPDVIENDDKINNKDNDDLEIDDNTHKYLAIFLIVAFLFVQGIFAGFSFTSLFQDVSNTNDISFLINYQNSASEYRRFFYLLTTLSLVGSLYSLLEISSKNQRQSANRTDKKLFTSNTDTLLFSIIVFTVIVHTLGFLASLIMSIVDTLISVKMGDYNSNNDNWATTAMNNDFFSKQMIAWRGLNKLRFISALVGWLGNCSFVWGEFLLSRAKTNEISRLRENISAWHKYSSMLEGRRLDNLDEIALSKIIAIQQLGLERSRETLELIINVEGGAPV